MAPPPVDRNGRGESTAGDMPRSLPTPFLTKTYQLVDDHTINNIISWNEDGSTFIVWNPTEFARDLLPKYFKHNNFSSFVRQLNTYGFRKIMSDRWEFSNEYFRKGEKKLLCDIQRRKIASPSSPMVPTPSIAVAVPPAPASPRRMVSPSNSGEEQVFCSSNLPATTQELNGSTVELIGENERLRKENMQLNKELCQMKSLCNKIYVLMSNYASTDKDNSSNTRQGHSGISDLEENAMKPLNLLGTRFCKEMQTTVVNAVEKGGKECNFKSATAEEISARLFKEMQTTVVNTVEKGGEDCNIKSGSAEEISARLFGVSIGIKRGRESEGRSAEHEKDLQQPARGCIKSELLDQSNNSDQESWLMMSSRNRRV